jgi:hypothetical protein
MISEMLRQWPDRARVNARSIAAPFAIFSPYGLPARHSKRKRPEMNLDDQIHRYFGTSNLTDVPPQALAAGIEHIKVDLGLTKDRGERFALWALLYILGSAPDLDVAFKADEDRNAARNFMDLIQGTSGA